MLIPKRIGTALRIRPALIRWPTSRCLSTTAARPWATPTNRYPPSDARGGIPVEDIDVVFDYPSDGQASHQKTPLEQSGLDLHSAMPHYPKASSTAAGMAGAQRMGKEMGYTDSNAMYRYIGLGALGLGGLYLFMRRRNPPAEPASKDRTWSQPAAR
ncbi:b14cec5e-8126-4869-bee9-d41d5cbd1dda [Thermothielavioides terrestris]|uniref:Uncharacterized protein n=2 Tax=Thermothielavioides terrestris TaxID=2587410 RepID=G2QWK9_THETT|nr:uncharacterized protein THITE_2111131 [Thermothielavioides terrestris NRRL 8126]AEO64784.1 hypothetical protein THITE_2111131 [Thermothielavioides terrestris NRRL 8126]SPQ20727.1 b14cec5e-8126-4869-bee9-d41d5cbd1dda [Thermothielavioides terrestris]